MPKPTKGPRLGGKSSHQKALLANLATSLFTHGRIKTTEPKARALRPYAEKLRAYGKLAEERFDAARFEEFCAKHLGHLDEVAWEFFGTQAAKDAFRQKVAALYPKHEVEQFTELFWRRVQAWRADEKA